MNIIPATVKHSISDMYLFELLYKVTGTSGFKGNFRLSSKKNNDSAAGKFRI